MITVRYGKVEGDKRPKKSKREGGAGQCYSCVVQYQTRAGNLDLGFMSCVALIKPQPCHLMGIIHGCWGDYML